MKTPKSKSPENPPPLEKPSLRERNPDTPENPGPILIKNCFAFKIIFTRNLTLSNYPFKCPDDRFSLPGKLFQIEPRLLSEAFL